MKRYVFPAFAEGSDAEGWSLFFPDLACITGADDLPQLAAMAREALQLHLTSFIDDGEEVPRPSDLQVLRADPEYADLLPMFVEVDLDGPPTAVVISLPQAVLSQVDNVAQARGLTRAQIFQESVQDYLKAS